MNKPCRTVLNTGRTDTGCLVGPAVLPRAVVLENAPPHVLVDVRGHFSSDSQPAMGVIFEFHFVLVCCVCANPRLHRRIERLTLEEYTLWRRPDGLRSVAAFAMPAEIAVLQSTVRGCILEGNQFNHPWSFRK
jgi:hypothetical protein